jgi:hypothetical protein
VVAEEGTGGEDLGPACPERERDRADPSPGHVPQVPGDHRPQEGRRLAARLEGLELAEQAVGGVNGADAGGANRADGLDHPLDPVGADAQPGRNRAGRAVQEAAVVEVREDVGGQPAVAGGQQRGHLGQQQLGGARPVRGCRPGIGTVLGWRAGAPREPGTALGAVVAGKPDTAAGTGRPVDTLEGGVAGQRTVDQLFQVGHGKGQQLGGGHQRR